MTPRILVAGIGNIFLGDDAFGVEVVRSLAERTWPDGIRIVDFGIRGFDLAAALSDGWDFALLIDAAPRGAPPGTLYVIEPQEDCSATANSSGALDGHRLDPLQALALAHALGGPLPRILVLGCEPSPPGGDEDLRTDLSPPVRAAVAESLALVESIIDWLRRLDPRSPSVSFAALFQGRSDHASNRIQTDTAPHQ
jgi:hydrogenase maturation protease